MKILAGNSSVALAKSVVQILDLSLAQASIKHFADKELFVEILENVRGEDVFIIQSTSYPANDHLMELLIILDALRRGSARRITAVIPYYGYARQDRKTSPRSPISAKLTANLITVAGASRVLTFDLHSAQIQGFFDIPLDNLFSSTVFSQDIIKNYGKSNVMVVSPDIGGVGRARAIAKRIDSDLAIIDKRRERAGVSEVVNIIGDVKGKNLILIDDIIDTAGTLCNAAHALMDAGALSVRAYVTHGVLSNPAVERIMTSPIHEIVVTDSIQGNEEVVNCPKIRFLSIAPLLAEGIKRISEEKSVSVLFD
ncbi:ribose-phosphate pyrophosphokinase [Caedimonas varicaedens]|jgi:ribose-phosphate pyrophosphokinase|uniref:Ribose-phosphate pyrophosphokinase n=1 Tax=Caedimonas varicaedens TaxID=1629334 RepID=A0A0K8MBY3_9PROT|nr:ribose-phosphate pyrophosphokinase [Caedimonas varicaedens]